MLDVQAKADLMKYESKLNMRVRRFDSTTCQFVPVWIVNIAFGFSFVPRPLLHFPSLSLNHTANDRKLGMGLGTRLGT